MTRLTSGQQQIRATFERVKYERELRDRFAVAAMESCGRYFTTALGASDLSADEISRKLAWWIYQIADRAMESRKS